MKPLHRIPFSTPAVAAVVVGSLAYSMWIRPIEGRVVDAERQLHEARAQAGGIQAEIARDRAIPSLPLPVTKQAFDRLWPAIVADVQDAGYGFQSVTFAVDRPLSLKPRTTSGTAVDTLPGGTATASAPNPPGGTGQNSAVPPARLTPTSSRPFGPPVTPVQITARFTGAYLSLDETLARIQDVLPLWSWRSLHLSSQPDAPGVTVTVDGVVPIDGDIGEPRTAPTQGPIAPPPPTPGGRP